MYLHEQANIAHRDIKPENLMIVSNQNDFDFKLVDFGLASFYEGDNMELKCGVQVMLRLKF